MNDGDSLEHDFSSLYDTLLYPFHFVFDADAKLSIQASKPGESLKIHVIILASLVEVGNYSQTTPIKSLGSKSYNIKKSASAVIHT